MNQFLITAVYLLACFVLTSFVRRYRLLGSQLAQAQRELVHLARQKDRLELVLRQAEPDMYAQVKARSETEWQQAVKHLGEDDVPVLYPLEPAFSPISPFHGSGSARPVPQGA